MSNSVAMDPRRLWAKSWKAGQKPPDGADLLGHLRYVHGSAAQVLDCTGDAQITALGLDPDTWRVRLRRVVLLAAAIHDLGKCNSQFAGMLRREIASQVLRHEWVTRLILEQDEWRNWLRPAVGDDERDWQAVLWCVSGHHPKYGRSAPPDLGEGPAGMTFPAATHPDIQQILGWLRSEFSLNGAPPKLVYRDVLFTLGEDDPVTVLSQRHFDSEDQFDTWDEPQRRFLAAAKDCLVAADIAGSALPKQVTGSEQRGRWISEVLGMKLPDAAAYRRIADAHLAQKPNSSVKDNDGRIRAEFQSRVADTPARVSFVRAGCGTGKTLAAYRWAEKKCSGRRLYVCYPTTGTALEGFKDYLLDPTLTEYVKTNLITSRAEVDLAIEGITEDRNEAVARIESLEMWRQPVVACTVDAVLGVIQNNRRGLFSWPAIAQGGFVFDEIHSYDDKLFDALLHFLSVIRGAPILLMTASLPDVRLEAIQKAVGSTNSLVELPGPTALEERPRYRREEYKDLKAVHQEVQREVNNDGRVLRVCNTVDAAMREADELVALGLSPILYHSRFKYSDRVAQHKRVVKAFKGEGRALAVCTQVAEMSLDLSATHLVTDLAPVSALIQRLGRLNRHAKGGERARPFVVVEPLGRDGKFSPLPYDADDLETAREWLTKLGTGDLRQSDLSAAWAKFQDATPPPRYQSAWLDFGPATPVLELREGSPSVTVIMAEDLPDLREGQKQIAEVTLPMPNPPSRRVGKGQPFEWQDGDYNGVPVARSGTVIYRPAHGARWNA